MLSRRKSGSMKKGKKAQQAREAELLRQASVASHPPPKLPQLYNGLREPVFETRDSVAIFGPNSPPRGQGQQAHRPPHQQLRAASMDAPRAISANIPIPPIPSNGGNWVDPYARTESMTNRGRYSYASSSISTVNNPRKVRRRKDPTPFNVLVVGTRGAGKTSFIEFLKTALALPPKKRSTSRASEDDDVLRPQPTGNFYPHYVESEIDGERVGLTLWDSEGLEKNVVDLQLREMSTFVESKFEETFAEEMKVIRSPGVQDTHIHCAFILLDPTRLDKNIAGGRALTSNGNGKYHSSRIVGSLDEDLDLQVLRTLQGKTTTIPIIAKADTITAKHMHVLKKAVWDSLKTSNLDPLEVLGLEDDAESRPSSNRIAEEPEDSDESEQPETQASDEGSDDEPAEDGELLIQAQDSPKSTRSKRQSISSVRRSMTSDELDEVPYIPMSIISPDIYEPEVIGRKFPWGFADPNNEEHCDFLRLKEAVFSEWRSELKEAARDQWYEGWRTSRLKQRDGTVRRR